MYTYSPALVAAKIVRRNGARSSTIYLCVVCDEKNRLGSPKRTDEINHEAQEHLFLVAAAAARRGAGALVVSTAAALVADLHTYIHNTQKKSD